MKFYEIGVATPSSEFQHLGFEDRHSLVDADVVLFDPRGGGKYGDRHHQGIPYLRTEQSHSFARAANHWHDELAGALQNGALILISLSEPVEYWSEVLPEGSRSVKRERTAVYGSRVSTYDAVPFELPPMIRKRLSTGVTPRTESDVLRQLWQVCEPVSRLDVYFDEPDQYSPFLFSAKGSKIVGLTGPVGNGHVVLIPALDPKEATGFGGPGETWSDAADKWGVSFVTAVVQLARAMKSGDSSGEAPPPWVLGSAYQTPDEDRLHQHLRSLEVELNRMRLEQEETVAQVQRAGEAKRLLYSKGSSLEEAVLSALRVLGFTATRFHDGGSEFDAVFESGEGRLLGEVEGRDEKPISIEKIRQLESNLHEDFSRDEVTAEAKGVLFGNGYRLRPPEARPTEFTEKCLTASHRRNIALVRTRDLYPVATYLEQTGDAVFAALCRSTILATDSGIVSFPVPPIGVPPGR